MGTQLDHSFALLITGHALFPDLDPVRGLGLVHAPTRVRGRATTAILHLGQGLPVLDQHRVLVQGPHNYLSKFNSSL